MASTFGSVTRCDIDKVTHARHFVCWPLFPSLPVRRKGIRLGDAWPSATPSGRGAQRCRPSAASIASVSGDACTSYVSEDMSAREVCESLVCAQCLCTCYCAWHRPLPFLDSIHRRFEQESPYHIRGTIIRNAAQILLQLHANHVPTPDTDPLVVVDPSSFYVRGQAFLAITRLHCPSVWSTCGDKIRDSEYAPEC